MKNTLQTIRTFFDIDHNHINVDIASIFGSRQMIIIQLYQAYDLFIFSNGYYFRCEQLFVRLE